MDFMKELETIPWFSQIGKPVESASIARQLTDWDEWPGPEDETVARLDLPCQQFCELVFARAGEQHDTAQELWKKTYELVKQLAAQRVPEFDDDEDCYHPPTAAVWEAAAIAALVAVCQFLDIDLSETVRAQWEWLRRGHWLCGLTDDGIVVY